MPKLTVKELITEVQSWITLKNDEASILSNEFKEAKLLNCGKLTVSQIYDAYVEVSSKRSTFNSILQLLNSV